MAARLLHVLGPRIIFAFGHSSKDRFTNRDTNERQEWDGETGRCQNGPSPVVVYLNYERICEALLRNG